jgi:NADPH:quinone reductase-like Zn-dependent oxidoreductase
MPGLTAWQGLFEHGRLHAGQSVLVHGAASVVGSMASQLAREAGAYVIGTGTLVTITGPTDARPAGGLTIDFVVVPDRAQLSEAVQRVRDGRLRTNIGNVAALDDAVAAFNPTERTKGKTIIRVHP